MILVYLEPENIKDVLGIKILLLIEPYLDPANHSPSNLPIPVPAPTRQPSKGRAYLADDKPRTRGSGRQTKENTFYADMFRIIRLEYTKRMTKKAAWRKWGSDDIVMGFLTQLRNCRVSSPRQNQSEAPKSLGITIRTCCDNLPAHTRRYCTYVQYLLTYIHGQCPPKDYWALWLGGLPARRV